MPVYAYECEACHSEFERRQSFADGPIKVCPNCGEPAARRLISSVGIIFKGSGFYITDNRKTSGEGKNLDTSPSPASKAKKSETETA